MNKKFKLWLKITSIIWGLYAVSWLCIMFVKMEYLHPFDYLIHIKEHDQETRIAILSMFLCSVIIKWVVISMATETDTKTKQL